MARSFLMAQAPNIKLIMRAVSMERIVLNVMYLKTFSQDNSV
jgi:hypothetical protein